MKANQSLVQFQLQNIEVSQFAIMDEVFIDENKLETVFGVNFGISEAQYLIQSTFEFSINSVGNTFLKLEVNCTFEIEENSFKKIQNDAGLFVLPVDFARHLSVITVGTARGILFCKTENTIYEKFLMPTINIEELLLDDVTF